MKKIALDLDGVVFDSENLYRVYTEMYDVDVMKGNNLVDNTKRKFQDRYNWGTDCFNEFYRNNSASILKTANVMTGADVIIKKISKLFDIIIVTARNDEEIEIAKDKLNQLGLGNIPIFNNENDKIDCFLKENVSYIIDDDEDICQKAASKNIKAIYLKNAASPSILENENLKVVNNWGEVYKYIMLNEKNAN